LELSPGWSPAAEDMASFSEDRGDAGRALELLLRAGAGNDDGTVQLLRRLRAGGSETGRNDPCPCGSGRKYKACHMGKEGIPLARRVGWLWNRAGSFMQRSHGRADLLEIAALIGGPYASSRQVLNLALEDGVVSDIALHEGGWFDRWLEARGALMPADERDLAEQWRSCDHGVYEVVGVSRGTGLTLRSAGDRTEISVTDGLASRTSHRGMWLFTRLVPDGTGALQIVAGGTPVETDAVEDLMATLATRPTHLELAAALGDAAVRTS
ncbi:MAG TPA: SEC-C domain-containing protein, partial [Acidimicrobiales bacterium]